MKDYENYPEISSEGIETPDGYLYNPPTQGKQVLFLIGSFFSAILLGLIVSIIAGDMSDVASGVIYFIYILVFILGYSAWAGRVSIMIFGTFKMPIIRTLYRFFVNREKAGSINDFLPSREEAIKIMVRSQKHTRLFFVISWPVGIAGALSTLLMKTSLNPAALFLLVATTAVMYGYCLYYFGRRGYMPLPEE
jgi:hypothetical protein